MLATSCQWQHIPKEFATFMTVQGYFYRSCRDDTLDQINHALVMLAREMAGPEISATSNSSLHQPLEATSFPHPILAGSRAGCRGLQRS